MNKGSDNGLCLYVKPFYILSYLFTLDKNMPGMEQV